MKEQPCLRANVSWRNQRAAQNTDGILERKVPAKGTITCTLAQSVIAFTPFRRAAVLVVEECVSDAGEQLLW